MNVRTFKVVYISLIQFAVEFPMLIIDTWVGYGNSGSWRFFLQWGARVI